MKSLVFGSSFKRAFKRLMKRQPELQQRIQERLVLLATDPFEPLLETHKLKGKLAGTWSCSVNYDYRIVFEFVENLETEEEDIFLIDIGSHDEVY